MLTPPELLFQVETGVMQNILSELQKGKTTPALWKADRLKAMGTLNTANIKLIKKYEQALKTGTAEEIKKAQDDALYRIDTIYKRAVKKGASATIAKKGVSEATQKITNAYVSQGGSELNYTLQSLLNNSKAIYKETIEKTSYEFLQGVTTLDQALQKTCSRWIGAGSLSIKDSAGRDWSPETYGRMILRTNQRQITTQVTLKRNEENGNTLIEVSSHGGARRGCAPYQGKVYTTGKDKGYPSLSSTSYGEPAGLFGINCRHDSYPFFKGLSSKAFDPKPFNKEEYNLTQEQRRNETAIRNAKRNLELTKANGGDVTKATAKVKAAQANQRAFINKTGRTRRVNREQLTT